MSPAHTMKFGYQGAFPATTTTCSTSHNSAMTTGSGKAQQSRVARRLSVANNDHPGGDVDPQVTHRIRGVFARTRRLVQKTLRGIAFRPRYSRFRNRSSP